MNDTLASTLFAVLTNLALLALLLVLTTLFGVAVAAFAGLPLWVAPVAGPALLTLLCWTAR